MEQVLNVLRGIPLVGPALRRLVRRYPEGSVVRIRSGVGRGLHWRRHHRYNPAVWLGTHEPQIQRLLQSMLKPGEVFYDVGANAGFFTVLAANLVGAEGRVVAFEPHPENVQSILEQIEVNGWNHVAVVEKAVGEGPGTVQFCSSASLSIGHVGAPRADEQVTEVPSTSLDDVLADERKPDLVKVDIEGGGVALAKGARRVAEECRPVWIIEVHDPGEEAAFKDLLVPLGYRFEALDRTVVSVDEKLPSHVIAVPN